MATINNIYKSQNYEGCASHVLDSENKAENNIMNDALEPNLSLFGRASQWAQDTCYQIFAYTIWDNLVSGFQPGRIKAIELMEIQPTDCILLVGEGSGLDFKCLPKQTNKLALRAFDFSQEMVRQSKIKARELDIPEENCFVGDAQNLPFTNEKFDKIYFPLSIASIPNPSLALREAERVLSPGGKIVVFDKLMDDNQTLSWGRTVLNIITKCIFADITRNLSAILKAAPSLKVIHYESLENTLEGVFARYVDKSYRLAVIIRDVDYPTLTAIQAIPSLSKDT